MTIKTLKTGFVVLAGTLLATPASAQAVSVAAAAAQAQVAAEKATAAAQTLAPVFDRDMQLALERATAAAQTLAPVSDRDMQMAIERAAAVSKTLSTAGLADMDLALARASEALGGLSQDRDREQADRARELAERDKERGERQKEVAQREKEQEARYYDAGQQALDSSRWDRAIEQFNRVVELKSTRADAALYWKAFAQNRSGQRSEALTTISSLQKDYPKSRYLEQAKALDVEVRRDAGQPVRPENESDEEMKLYALNALQNSDPEQAVPMLQKILQGNSSPKLKERALFVLAQSSSARAREVLVNIAKGNGATPDVQFKAIQYLGLHGNRESRAALGDIYSSTTDVDIKRRILRAFMVGGEKDRLLTAAQSEQNPELRAEAVRQLGVMGANEELWTMYQKESSLDVKKQIMQAMFVGGNSTRMIDLAKSERTPELRRVAVRNLGLMGGKRTGDALVEIYTSDKDPEIRKSVVQALFLQSNAESLVAIARKESDHEMQKEIVQKLSLMGNNKAARDYLLEILNK